MTKPDRSQLEAMRLAIAALPGQTRDIYRLHLVDGLGYKAIAGQLGIDSAEVERHIAEAIVLIDRELRGQERGGSA